MLEKIPHCTQLPGGYEALGVIDAQGDLVGGCLYTNFRPAPDRQGGDIEMWAVGNGRWLDRGVMQELFGYPFNQLGCHRVTCITRRKGRDARRLLEKLGFRLEGVVRQGLKPHGDAMVYGLLKHECRWL